MNRIDAMKKEQATAVLVDFCHTNLRSWGTKLFWALPCENLRLLMWLKHPIMRCRIARTTLYPTVPAAEESRLHKAEIGGNEDNLWIWGYQRQD